MALGCGNQETYINCADVAIGTNTGGFAPGIFVPQPQPYFILTPYGSVPLVQLNYQNVTNERQSLVVRSQACIARIKYSRDERQPYFDAWCMANCLKYPPTCPDDICHCL